MTTVYLFVALGIVLALAIWLARRWGQEAERASYLEDSHDNAVEARKIDDAVAAMPESELDKRLRGDG